jgi:hypothetical protein
LKPFLVKGYMDIPLFGKSPQNPIKAKGIEASLLYLHSLLTEDFRPILFHRIRSSIWKGSKPIDCYEVMKSSELIDYIFIDTYATENSAQVPDGYIFYSGKRSSMFIKGIEVSSSIGVNYRLKLFPEALLENQQDTPFLSPQTEALLSLVFLRQKENKTDYMNQMYEVVTGVMRAGLVQHKPDAAEGAIKVLIQHFQQNEAYEKCAALQKLMMEIKQI